MSKWCKLPGGVHTLSGVSTGHSTHLDGDREKNGNHFGLIGLLYPFLTAYRKYWEISKPCHNTK